MTGPWLFWIALFIHFFTQYNADQNFYNSAAPNCCIIINATTQPYQLSHGGVYQMSPDALCILMIYLLMKIDNDTSVSQDWSLYEGPSRKCDSCLNHIIALRTADERLWGTGVHRNRVVNILLLNRRLKVRTVANIMVKTDKPIFLSHISLMIRWTADEWYWERGASENKVRQKCWKIDEIEPLHRCWETCVHLTGRALTLSGERKPLLSSV